MYTPVHLSSQCDQLWRFSALHDKVFGHIELILALRPFSTSLSPEAELRHHHRLETNTLASWNKKRERAKTKITGRVSL